MLNIKKEIDNRIKSLNEFKKKYNLNYCVFTIGNTRVNDNFNYYFTPFRRGDNFISIGVVIFSEVEGKIIMNLIDGKVDYIYVDCEKKSKNYNHEGFFNLERLAVENIMQSKFRFMKGNDITCESLDTLVVNLFKKQNRLIGGSNILIIGLGNLGFKISLKLVERGGNVEVISRNIEKTSLLVKAINEVKPFETISKVEIVDINNFNNNSLDFIILTHNSSDVRYDPIYDKINNKTIVIDVGKGCLTSDQITLLANKSVLMFRLDIGDTFVNFIDTDLKNSHKTFEYPSMKIIDNQRIISRGLIGSKGDLIVDSIEKPEFIYGICDGNGSLDLNFTESQKDELLKKLNNLKPPNE